MPILDDRIVLILRSCLGAWIKDLNHYDNKRGVADLSVNDTNYECFGQILNILKEMKNVND